MVPQKTQYAVRAVFELAKRYQSGVATSAEVAQAQAIPPSFLETIFPQLKQAGIVQSSRGAKGGYVLIPSPDRLAVGTVIRSMGGSFAPVKCVAGKETIECPLKARCAFMDLWAKARDAVAGVYDSTTFQDLIKKEKAIIGQGDQINYCI